MLNFTQSMRQNLSVSPPRTHQASPNQLVGESVVLATSAVALALDLRSLPTPTFSQATAQSQQPAGAVGHYITIFADTADLGIIFGPTLASVTGGNVPALATNGTLTSNAYTGAAGTCHRIPAGQERRFQILAGQDLFLGFVASAAGQMRLYQSSPSGV